jgi:meiotically up-regulated gene 157 (Mug157) protein
MLLRVIIPATLAIAVLGGCTVQEPTYPPTRGAVLGDNTPRTVDYPNGRYQLYGDGTTASPYYWAWIPAGSSPPAPPPIPPARR